MLWKDYFPNVKTLIIFLLPLYYVGGDVRQVYSCTDIFLRYGLGDKDMVF